MIWIVKWTLLIIFSGPAIVFSLSIKSSSFSENQSNMDNWTEFKSKNTREKPDMSNPNVNETIQNIFILGSEDDTVIFHNNTRSSHDHLKIPAQTNNRSFNNEDFFKVKRDPAGKLNLVFNDYIFSQDLTSSVELRSSENQTQLQMSPSSSRKRTNNGGAITFPDDLYEKPICLDKGKPFCKDVQNYPKRELEKILKHEFANYDMFFGNDLPQPLNISQRMSPGQESMCATHEQISFPKAGETMNNGWLYIINHGNYTQGVKTEICKNEGSPCMFAQIFPNGYVATCEQQYIYRSLYAFGKNGTIVNDHFKFPSCCKCIIKQL